VRRLASDRRKSSMLERVELLHFRQERRHPRWIGSSASAARPPIARSGLPAHGRACRARSAPGARARRSAASSSSRSRASSSSRLAACSSRITPPAFSTGDDHRATKIAEKEPGRRCKRHRKPVPSHPTWRACSSRSGSGERRPERQECGIEIRNGPRKDMPDVRKQKPLKSTVNARLRGVLSPRSPRCTSTTIAGMAQGQP